MPKHIEAIPVDVKEGFDPIEIEVFLCYYEGQYKPFASAYVVDDNVSPYIPKEAIKVERYTFKVKRPELKGE